MSPFKVVVDFLDCSVSCTWWFGNNSSFSFYTFITMEVCTRTNAKKGCHVHVQFNHFSLPLHMERIYFLSCLKSKTKKVGLNHQQRRTLQKWLNCDFFFVLFSVVELPHLQLWFSLICTLVVPIWLLLLLLILAKGSWKATFALCIHKQWKMERHGSAVSVRFICYKT